MAIVNVKGQSGKAVEASEGSGSFSLLGGAGTQNLTVTLGFVPNLFAIYAVIGSYKIALYWYGGDLLTDFAEVGNLSGNPTIQSISVNSAQATIAFVKYSSTLTVTYQWKAFKFE